MTDSYITKAEKLIEANFRIYGIGHFDLQTEEYALVLEYIEKGDYQSLNQLYARLEKQRLG